MNEDLRSVLWSMWKRREQQTWVFYNKKEGTRYNRRPKLMRSLCRRAGIKEYGFHAIRHFVATYLHDVKKIPTGVSERYWGTKPRERRKSISIH